MQTRAHIHPTLILSLSKLKKLILIFAKVGSLKADTKTVSQYELRFILPTFRNRSMIFDAVFINNTCA